MNNKKVFGRTSHKGLNNRAGFTLVELIGIMTIIAILAGISAIPLVGVIQQAKMRAERENLSRLGQEIKASFRQDDLNNINISSLPGDIPENVIATVFDDNLALAAGFDADAWYARLLRSRGIGFTEMIGRNMSTIEGDAFAITHNTYGQRRVLIAGPEEPNVQRYIILSFMFSDSFGATMDFVGFPRNDAAAFNRLYNHDWGRAEGVPAAAGFTGGRWADRSSRGYTFAQKVIVERITQPRFYLTVQNTSGVPEGGVIVGDNLYCYKNVLGVDWSTARHTDPALDVDWGEYPPQPMDSTAIIPQFPRKTKDPVTGDWDDYYGILEGRRVIVRRGQTETTAYEVYSFLLNENTAVTAQ